MYVLPAFCTPRREPAPARAPIRSWAEDYVAKVEAAKAFLNSLGFNVRRVCEERPVWYVSSYPGEFDADLLVRLAEYRGFVA